MRAFSADRQRRTRQVPCAFAELVFRAAVIDRQAYLNGWNFHIAYNAVFGRAEQFAVVRAFFFIGLADKKGIVIDFGLLECVGQIGILYFCKCLFLLGQDHG